MSVLFVFCGLAVGGTVWVRGALVNTRLRRNSALFNWTNASTYKHLFVHRMLSKFKLRKQTNIILCVASLVTLRQLCGQLKCRSGSFKLVRFSGVETLGYFVYIIIMPQQYWPLQVWTPYSVADDMEDVRSIEKIRICEQCKPLLIASLHLTNPRLMLMFCVCAWFGATRCVCVGGAAERSLGSWLCGDGELLSLVLSASIRSFVGLLIVEYSKVGRIVDANACKNNNSRCAYWFLVPGKTVGGVRSNWTCSFNADSLALWTRTVVYSCICEEEVDDYRLSSSPATVSLLHCSSVHRGSISLSVYLHASVRVLCGLYNE